MNGSEERASSTLPMAEIEVARPAERLLRVDGRFDLLAPVGRGGMAYVYRAQDLQTGEMVAVKVLRSELSGRMRVVERLAAEAVTMTLLNHPNTVQVRAMGIDHEQGILYIAMEWIPGGSLLDALAGGPIPLPIVARWGIEVLCALDAAHARGIIHRDVKPANILLGADGRALLTDFGVALVPDVDGDRESEGLLGTYAYMAPEQQQLASAVGPSADLYAMAATLYALCTSESAAGLSLREGDDLKWSLVPAPLRDILFRATRPSPEARYANAREMALALVPIADPGALASQEHLGRWLDLKSTTRGE